MADSRRFTRPDRQRRHRLVGTRSSPGAAPRSPCAVRARSSRRAAAGDGADSVRTDKSGADAVAWAVGPALDSRQFRRDAREGSGPPGTSGAILLRGHRCRRVDWSPDYAGRPRDPPNGDQAELRSLSVPVARARGTAGTGTQPERGRAIARRSAKPASESLDVQRQSWTTIFPIIL